MKLHFLLAISLAMCHQVAQAQKGLMLEPNTGSSSNSKGTMPLAEEVRARLLLAGEAILPGMSPEEVQAILGRPPTRVEGPSPLCGKEGVPAYSAWCNFSHHYSGGVTGRSYTITYHKSYGALRLRQQDSRFYDSYTKFNCSFRPNLNTAASVRCLNSYIGDEK